MKAVVIHSLSAVRLKVVAALRGNEWKVCETATPREGLRAVARENAAAVLCAFTAQRGETGELIHALRQLDGRVVVIALGEHGGQEAREAMDLGADDYLPISASLEAIRHCVRTRYQRARAFMGETENRPSPEVIMGALFRDKHFGLTHRESEVLAWLVQGKGNQDLSVLLEISPRTVEKHVEAIYNKLGVETRSAAMLLVIERTGLFTRPARVDAAA